MEKKIPTNELGIVGKGKKYFSQLKMKREF